MTRILELHWHPNQTLTDPDFHPLRLPHNRYAHWREMRAFVDFYRQGNHLQTSRTGIFSSKFQLKSLITGRNFIDFSETNAEADVCLINVFPGIPYYSYNVWMQGEAEHPGITGRAQALVNASGLSWDLSKTPRHNRHNLCYGNFWVGNAAFWEGFVGGVLCPIAAFLETYPHSPVALAVFERARYRVEAPFLPFIAERLLSTFLSLEPIWRVASYTHSKAALLDCSLTDFQREVVAHLKPLIDRSDAKGLFPTKLIKTQALFSRLVSLHNGAYFQSYPHPHNA